jgi:hypothetical protein
MSNNKLTAEDCQPAMRLLKLGHSHKEIGNMLDISKDGVHRRIKRYKELGLDKNTDFEPSEIPSGELNIDELLDRRSEEWVRRNKHEEAKKLIDVRIKLEGPIGIAHFGDPHVDDPGCNFDLLRRDVEICRTTEGLLAGNVGDLQNNWVGRLNFKYADQSTTAQESWLLVEWLMKEVPWLYLVGGNHDAWSGNGDPLKWIMRQTNSVFDYDGVRLNLKFPNGKQVRVNSRHDFAGHSQWNEIHGLKKAAMMGWRDHILTCGHKHTSNFMFAVDPSNGFVSNLMRVAGYKKHDDYAQKLGLPDHAIFPTAVTIIDPQYADNDMRLIHTMFDVEAAADYLTHLRKKFKKG